MSAAPALDVEELTFAYGREANLVLDIPRFAVERREKVFLHGPSGSGKTTLLGLLAGILIPRSGRVRVLGHELSQLGGQGRDRVRGAHIGYIFQMFNLIPYLSVRDNILLPCRLSPERLARLPGPPAAAAEELARRLRIEHLLPRPVTTLSVGQQQRVAAARALIGSPGLVIADEPTSALDAEHREAFLQLLFEEAERAGTSVLFVSHDQSLKPLFQRVVSLRELNRAALQGGTD